jgi:hypothetical protein
MLKKFTQIKINKKLRMWIKLSTQICIWQQIDEPKIYFRHHASKQAQISSIVYVPSISIKQQVAKEWKFKKHEFVCSEMYADNIQQL